MKPLGSLAVLFFVFFQLACVSEAQSKPLDEMGCFNCHLGGDTVNPFHERLPDLSQVGLRYTSEHLWEYLKDPKPMRGDLGLARMPLFPLGDPEWVHLIEYLQTQKRVKAPTTLLKVFGRLRRCTPRPCNRGQGVVLERVRLCGMSSMGR